ncbi:hypothetical protein H6P81_001712 [Aristolochia fimbriata]|uniref:FAF domain-containing protein n=1 Tax=Aristolochia fimbriata TaxID=158543 RepID=A0AAV7F968_ARIFI|nr:hypothetical protein H6P81_001712 [Aristolochia fimbriata]
MSAVSRRSRSSVIEEERKRTEKQGIGSILRTSDKQGRPSLRRTFSADMSSKKWLTDQTLKKEENEERRRREEDMARPAQFDIWSSILAQKERDSSDPLNLPPYVPPLKKRSSSSLSQKSLEICTESLGSETGSDGFSSDFDCYSSSEEEDEQQQQQQTLVKEIPVLPKCVFSAPSSRRCPPRSFPPPLPSISRRDGAPRIHMRPHRKDGRLVLEAVPVPTQNCLHAERQDGRLLLTLIKPLPPKAETREVGEGEKEEEIRTPTCEQVTNHLEEMIKAAEEPHEEVGKKEAEEVIAGEAAVADKQYLVEVKLHRSVMNKLIKGIPFRNPNPWSSEKKMTRTEEKVAAAEGIRLATAAPTAFNTYECSWKRLSTRQPPTGLQLSPPHQNHQKQLLLAKNQLPATFTVNTCKEPKRTLIIWDTYCVATT